MELSTIDPTAHKKLKDACAVVESVAAMGRHYGVNLASEKPVTEEDLVILLYLAAREPFKEFGMGGNDLVAILDGSRAFTDVEGQLIAGLRDCARAIKVRIVQI